MITKQYIPYYIIIFSLFLGISASTLWTDGMFMDGLFYSTCAKNLSNGLGSFWFPHFSNSLFPIFHEHPPLALGMQSLLFSMLGESIYIERIYSFSTFILTGIFIHLIWQEISHKKYISLSWVPLFLWIIIPINVWSCSNNMLENTMNIFVSSSVFFAIKHRKNQKILYIILSALSLSLAFLSKGFVGLFPLSIFIWMFIFFRKINLKEMIIKSLLLIIFTAIPFILLYFYYPIAIDSLTKYINKQVLGSIQYVETVDTRLFIIKKLILELLPILMISIILLFIARKKNLLPTKKETQWSGLLICLGLSGVLPIMVSMKQSGFYILTSLPFFSIALSLLIIPFIHSFITSVNKRIITIISIVLLISSTIISISQYGKIGRDKDMIEDIRLIIGIVPHNSSISINKHKKRSRYDLIGYFARYGNISLDKNNDHKYYLKYKDDNRPLDKKYIKVEIDTKILSLYREN